VRACQNEYVGTVRFYTVGVGALYFACAVAHAAILGFRIHWHLKENKGCAPGRRSTNVFLLHATLLSLCAACITNGLNLIEFRSYQGVFGQLTQHAFSDLTILFVVTAIAFIVSFWYFIVKRVRVWLSIGFTRQRVRILTKG
jgi:hypothetical protein